MANETRCPSKEDLAKCLQSSSVLVVDANMFMRKTIRTLLTNIGIKTVHEAADGTVALERILMHEPDLVILEWNLPLLDGLELVRIVRSPGVFPTPDVPIMMLTACAERGRVVAAAAYGVNEFLIKPVSAKTLRERIISIFLRPRPVVRIGKYYGPIPRRQIDGIWRDGNGKDDTLSSIVRARLSGS